MSKKSPPPIPSCVYFGKPHELRDEIRRNRARFRRRTKPYLRRVLCYCTRPWEPPTDLRPQARRPFWMRVRAIALLEALAPFDPALLGDLAFDWAGVERWSAYDASVDRYVGAIEVTVGVPDWPAVTRALRALEYRVERTAAGVDGEGDFPVAVRAARAGDDALDAQDLRELMDEHYSTLPLGLNQRW